MTTEKPDLRPPFHLQEVKDARFHYVRSTPAKGSPVVTSGPGPEFQQVGCEPALEPYAFSQSISSSVKYRTRTFLNSRVE
ncbi:hypothetical protein Hsar01_03527 [Haloferula sargassicola]|uniref:Uncharacterized protein n=1 Tax=Haloferula sargassicola TaxID=490096 RepID=A0ABP9USR5_9BACT